MCRKRTRAEDPAAAENIDLQSIWQHVVCIVHIPQVQAAENIDLQSIWQQELARQDKYRTLKAILGSVQMGTVAYLTYLHLKKYGFK